MGGPKREREKKQMTNAIKSVQSQIALRLESRPTARDNCVKKCDVGVKFNLLFFCLNPPCFMCVCV